jgi:hypothetical protein
MTKKKSLACDNSANDYLARKKADERKRNLKTLFWGVLANVVVYGLMILFNS